MTVRLQRGESQESLLKRWRHAVRRSGILGEMKKRRWAMSKGERRRHKDRGAQRRRVRREKWLRRQRNRSGGIE